jgi:uncharacterized protein DUF1552
MSRASRGLSRRRFIAAAAGGTVLLPLLDSLRVQAQTAAPAPTRLLLLFNPNGTIEDAFWPAGNPPTGPEFELGPILQPLQAFKSKMTLLDGLDLAVAAKGPGGPHQKGMGGLFTGSTLQTGEMADGDGQRAGWADGISVDQEIVRRLDPPTLLPSLELGVRATAAEVRSRMIYTGPAAAVPPLNDPRDVFQRLVSGFHTNDLGPSDESAKEQRRLVLKAVHQQYDTLKSRVSREDREKLERHSEFVNGMSRRLDFSIGDSPACAEPSEPPALDFNNENEMPDVVKLQLDLLATAFICDITRVASMQFSSAVNAIRFPWMNSMVEGHDLSHRGASDMDARNQLIERAQWYSQQVAYLLQRLDSVPEGDGTVLDHTLVVWGNELSVGSTHLHRRIPFVTFGSANGQLNTGLYMKYPGYSHNQLLVTMMKAMGVEAASFGDPDFAGGGVLTGLFK